MAAFVALVDVGGSSRLGEDAGRAIPFLRPAPEGHEHWSGCGFAVARARCLVCPEDRLAELPDESSVPDIVCVADARIDNRDELLSELAGRVEGEMPSDTQLIVAAYRRWQVDCSSRLSGDFAFVIWDRGQRRVLATTDALGVRHIRYAAVDGRMVFGTRTRAVAACLAGKPHLNTRFLRELLAGPTERWIEETPFAEIRRLPAGYSLVIENGSPRRIRYAQLRPRPLRRHATDEQYTERFRELLTQSVRARLRSRTPVGLSLSGGLDSSAIACIAHQVSVSGGSPNRLRAYYSAFPATPTADERLYVQAVLERCPGISATFVLSDDCRSLRDTGEPFHVDEIDTMGGRLIAMRRSSAAARDGVRAILGGHWADQLLGSGYARPPAFGDVSPSRWFRELPHFYRASGRRFAAGALKEAARRLLRLPRRRFAGRESLSPPPLPGDQAHWTYWNVLGGAQVTRRASFEALEANAAVEWRFPFLDRSLVEFMLALPSRLRQRDGVTKLVLRNAMGDMLPPLVRDRTWPAIFDDAARRTVNDERPRLRQLAAASRAVAKGWTTESELRERIERSATALGYQSLTHLLRWLALEEWLRKVEAREGL